MNNPRALMLEGWCSPTLRSPAGRPYSVLELTNQHAKRSASRHLRPLQYLEEEQWDKEAMVLSTIAGQLEDEEDEDVECELAEEDEEASAGPDAESEPRPQ